MVHSVGAENTHVMESNIDASKDINQSRNPPRSVPPDSSLPSPSHRIPSPQQITVTSDPKLRVARGRQQRDEDRQARERGGRPTFCQESLWAIPCRRPN